MATKRKTGTVELNGEKINVGELDIYVRIHLTEELLGTASNDPELHERFIASKAPILGDDGKPLKDENGNLKVDKDKMQEEIAALGVGEVVERAMTVFPRTNDGRYLPHLYDYHFKGYFKDSCKAMKKVPGTLSSKTKAYKQEIDGLCFPFPRKIVLEMKPGTVVGECQRPLRASTMQGERVALAHSETVPAGTTMTLVICCLTKDMNKLCRELLDYGRLKGLGQWRNSGKGRFLWEELDLDGNQIGGNWNE